MAINVSYGDVGPYLGYAYRAALNEQLNKNSALRSEQESRALQAQAAMTSALAHGEAVRQGSIDSAMQQEAANSRDTAHNQTQANLLGTQEQYQTQRDQQQNIYQTLRDRNLNQMRVTADEQNDSRTAIREQQNRMIQMGTPLTQEETNESQRLGTQLSRIAQKTDLSDDEKLAMQRPLQERYGYLQNRQQAATQRQEQERQRIEFRNWSSSLMQVDRGTGQITPHDPTQPLPPGRVVMQRDQHGMLHPIQMPNDPGVMTSTERTAAIGQVHSQLATELHQTEVASRTREGTLITGAPLYPPWVMANIAPAEAQFLRARPADNSRPDPQFDAFRAQLVARATSAEAARRLGDRAGFRQGMVGGQPPPGMTPPARPAAGPGDGMDDRGNGVQPNAPIPPAPDRGVADLQRALGLGNVIVPGNRPQPNREERVREVMDFFSRGNALANAVFGRPQMDRAAAERFLERNPDWQMPGRR